jgi:hypothetical protein
MKRPWAVTVLGLLFIVAGLLGLFYHLTTEKLAWDLTVVLLLRLLAVAGGIFLLFGRSWARWLIVAWLAIHVVVSALHSIEQMAAHAVLLVIVTYFLFKEPEANYFRSTPPA